MIFTFESSSDISNADPLSELIIRQEQGFFTLSNLLHQITQLMKPNFSISLLTKAARQFLVKVTHLTTIVFVHGW